MFQLQDKDLNELKRVKQVLENESVQEMPLDHLDPEIKKYREAILGLKRLGAFEFNTPRKGVVGVVANTVAVKRFDETTERKLRDQGIPSQLILGFQWATVPVLIGPREVIAPRYHPRQKPLLDRVRTYYRLKKRAGWQLELVENWLSTGIVPCSYTQTWREFGISMLLPACAVNHDEYRNPQWHVITEAASAEVKLSRGQS